MRVGYTSDREKEKKKKDKKKQQSILEKEIIKNRTTPDKTKSKFGGFNYVY